MGTSAHSQECDRVFQRSQYPLMNTSLIETNLLLRRNGSRQLYRGGFVHLGGTTNVLFSRDRTACNCAYEQEASSKCPPHCAFSRVDSSVQRSPRFRSGKRDPKVSNLSQRDCRCFCRYKAWRGGPTPSIGNGAVRNVSQGDRAASEVS